MADKHSKQVRSYNMSKIRAKDTKPEMTVRKFLHSNGFRYRLNSKKLIGKPDIVLPKYKTVIFIHGCFWHGHMNCKYFTIPETRTEWWLNKIDINKKHDAKVIQSLLSQNWRVIIIWTCELKAKTKQAKLAALLDEIRKPSTSPEKYWDNNTLL
ncbi:very short patch repair endonuclease [Chitinophaga filiformis]|uniref:Very short patch repair endonuclease n=1 Tax=Chitinophaga filiformis TaxID=104663 RepID=A0ABY4IAW0_CHIFI|nr:DNA mismatch endonuclease Vsr [Chitinophaga filiformis]UPK72459.1 DNA mismatch endonuclease Vsr [Chitinophaga filiformis]